MLIRYGICQIPRQMDPLDFINVILELIRGSSSFPHFQVNIFCPRKLKEKC